MRRSTSWWRASSGERLALLALLLLGCTNREARPRPPPPTSLTLFVSAEVRGYLGPCGCSENMRGGLSRAAHQVAEARRAGHPVYFVDAGDGLFGTSALPPEAVGQQERKARALAEGWRAMGLAARAPGPLDDARGAAFREALGLPEVPRGGFVLLERLAVVHAPDVGAAEAVAGQARAAGAAFVVALVPLPFDVLLQGAPAAPTVNLLVSSRSRGEFAAEESRLAGGAVKVAQVQSKGRSLLRLDVHLPAEGPVSWLRGDGERQRELRALDERIELLRAQVNEPMLDEALKALRKGKLEELIARRSALAEVAEPAPAGANVATARFVPLETTAPQDAAVQRVERAYDEDVGRLNLAWAKAHGQSCPPASPGARGVVGSALCFGCHPLAEAAWRKTKHPQAWGALTAVGKQHHLDCVSCHVTGWQQPQGVCRLDETEGREEVGCEACHGPGSEHVNVPIKATISRGAGEQTCVGCHDRENSPHFEYQTWLPRLLGPGHGQR